MRKDLHSPEYANRIRVLSQTMRDHNIIPRDNQQTINLASDLSLPIGTNERALGLGHVALKLDEIGGVTLPEEKRLEQLPNLLVAPVLTNDVSWVHLTANVEVR